MASPKTSAGGVKAGIPVSPIGTAAKKTPPVSGLGSIANGVQPPAPTSPAATSPAAGDSTPSAATDGAYAKIYDTLNTYGLGSLASVVWNKLLAGEDPQQIMNIDLPQTTEYKTRFAGNVALQAKGQTPLSPGDYLQYETAVRNQAELYGIDASHTSDAAIADLIGGGVSASEATQRLATYYQAAQQIDPTARDYLAKNFGITTGNLMDVFMNPDEHLAALQAKVNASQIGGAAQTTGWGQLDAGYAMKLAQAGVNPNTAATSFSKLAGFQELTQALPGDTTGTVNQADELSAEFDQNAAAQAKLQRVASGRVAAFANSGSYATDQSGAVGLRDQTGPY